MKHLQFVLLIAALLASCTPSPRAINYGTDVCNFCKMTVVDQQHAAELVTDKGKVHVFDAIECMVHQMQQPDQAPGFLILVNDYQQPGVLIDARSCTFLISEAIPSPMGAHLSAFANRQSAMDLRNEKGGQIYSWPELRTFFDQQSTNPITEQTTPNINHQ